MASRRPKKDGMESASNPSYRMMALRVDDKMAQLALVRQARRGDVEAFEELYRFYNDRIFNFARQIVESDCDAADVVQETFVRAWKSLPKLRDDGAFGGWLYRIALSRSKELLGGTLRRAEVSLEDGIADLRETDRPDSDPERAIINSEAAKTVAEALAELSPDHRAVVAMHHMEGVDVAEVARLLGVPQGTVMSRLSRARAALRRKLAAYVGFEHDEKI